MTRKMALTVALIASAAAFEAGADEGVFGYVRTAETLPKGEWDFEQWFTWRWDKSAGSYTALDTKTEFEYGFSDRFQGAAELYGLGINTSGLAIDAYIPPGDEKYAFKPAGVEAAFKYNFLSPVKDAVGIAQYVAISYFWLDTNSGRSKDVYSIEGILIAQKYFMDGELNVAGNLGIEATSATRAAIDGLPDDFEWPTHPEMEIELTLSGAIAYRFAPNWFAGLEVVYQNEQETEVGTERWSLQGGPTLHYAAKQWWATLTWLPQWAGGASDFPDQTKSGLQLIEKTAQELRLKIGINF
jgi:hypothetical protein